MPQAKVKPSPDALAQALMGAMSQPLGSVSPLQGMGSAGDPALQSMMKQAVPYSMAQNNLSGLAGMAAQSGLPDPYGQLAPPLQMQRGIYDGLAKPLYVK